MTTEQISNKVIDVISDKTGIMKSVINNDSKINKDLLMDSLDILELEILLEKEFEIPLDITTDFIPETIQEVVNLISKKLS